jgi:hypothetical protein
MPVREAERAKGGFRADAGTDDAVGIGVARYICFDGVTVGAVVPGMAGMTCVSANS